MKIFPDQPKLTKADRTKLEDAGYLNSWNTLNRTINKLKPGVVDLKRLILIELESDHPRKPVVERLLGKLQKEERKLLVEKIKKSAGGQRLRKAQDASKSVSL